jgi:hypothetical protein
MAALSGLRERQKTTRRTSRCSLERSGATSHNNDAARSIAVLHVLLRRCSVASRGAARVAAVLQRCKPWCCKLRRCGVASCNAVQRCGVASCNAVELQLVWLQHYGATRGCNAVALQLAWLRRYGAAACMVTMLRRYNSRGCDVAALQLV